MGIDYYNCAKCGGVFADCESDIGWCDHCHNMFCSKECADFDETPDDEDDEQENPQCCICRCDFDDLSNDIAFPLLLDVLGMSRETAIHLIRGHMLQDDEDKAKVTVVTDEGKEA